MTILGITANIFPIRNIYNKTLSPPFFSPPLPKTKKKNIQYSSTPSQVFAPPRNRKGKQKKKTKWQ